jgi:chemotaxis methyl-accepting protein methylase
MIRFFLRVNQATWKRLPAWLRNTRLLRWYGGILHRIVRTRAQRRQYHGTAFLRNRPELEQIVRVARARPEGSALKIAVLGCSSGCEVYSVLWSIRSARPDLDVRSQALDIAPQIVEAARLAVYTPESSQLVDSSIFERLSEQERLAMFDWDGESGTVKPWIRQGIQWHVGDASDPGLIKTLGLQDIVLASNFLCHMPAVAAESCLRNIARLVAPRGHIFVLGVDLEVREKVARELGWQPVPDLIREIHDGDPSVRKDWPWDWWGLEPLNDRRKDLQLRYGVAFRVT